jgi:alpha-galactosidase/6-phospho-beta-glucosidase family protein
MKIVMVGAGAHRVLPILRSALALPGALEDGHITLVDLNPERVEAMGRILAMSPESRQRKCRIDWTSDLDAALEGADAVGTIMPALSPRAMIESADACLRNGFISSDNISPTGAMCAVKVAPVLLNIARKMEASCPNAWLVNFVNPVAVISGMINNHTSIRTLGVCQGFTNHLWDIPRILGRDQEAVDLEVTAAGVNHLSYILRGSLGGEDLFSVLRRHLSEEWSMPPLSQRWSESTRQNIRKSVSQLVHFWQKLGVLIFSTEGDGMAHLDYEAEVSSFRGSHKPPSSAEVDAFIAEQAAQREGSNRDFEQFARRDLDNAFWVNQSNRDARFERADNDIFVRIFSAISGNAEERIVASRCNEGAILGFKDRETVEYSFCLSRDGIRHDGPYEIPSTVKDLTSRISSHQTHLGDAIATGDPELLSKALLAYPIRPDSPSLRATFKELFAISGGEIRPDLKTAAGYF